MRVFGPAVPPKTVVVTLTVGGAAGDGSVSVRSGGPNAPAVGSVATGGSGAVTVSPATEIWLHYQAMPGKPATVEVQCEFDIN